MNVCTFCHWTAPRILLLDYEHKQLPCSFYGPNRPLFVYFRSFHMTKIAQIL